MVNHVNPVTFFKNTSPADALAEARAGSGVVKDFRPRPVVDPEPELVEQVADPEPVVVDPAAELVELVEPEAPTKSTGAAPD